MASRKNFHDLAVGLVSRFVSRNNDIDGFWGVGVLSRAVHDAGRTQWSLDLLSTGDAFDHNSRGWLLRRLEETNVPSTWLVSASLLATFAPHVGKPVDVWWWKQVARHGVLAYRITVTAVLRDDHGREWTASADTWCWDHDPGRESRNILEQSARASTGRAAQDAG